MNPEINSVIFSAIVVDNWHIAALPRFNLLQRQGNSKHTKNIKTTEVSLTHNLLKKLGSFIKERDLTELKRTWQRDRSVTLFRQQCKFISMLIASRIESGKFKN